MADLKTRKPDPTPQWPRVLLSGEPGAGAEWMAAELTSDVRLAAAYWLEIGDDANADLYAQAEGASFDVIDHNNTWLDMYEQLDAAWQMARDAALPVALIVTSMSGVRSVLNDAATAKGRRRHATVLAGRGLDPAAAFSSESEVDVGPDIRTLMTTRHQQLIGKIRTWPGPVIMTARETRALDGRWVLKGSDQLGFDVTAWIRLTRDDEPEILVLDAAQHLRMTRSQREQLRPHFTLPRLIWDWFGCDERTRAPEPRAWDADQVMPGEQPTRVLQAVKDVHPVPRGRTRPSTTPVAATSEPAEPEALAPEVLRQVLAFMDEWLGLDARADIQKTWELMQAEVGSALCTRIGHMLSEEDRAATGTTKTCTLEGVALRAAQHIRRTGTALRPAAAGVAS
jgi:hypothetical protein